jgi:alpha-tubulin suppressor-like RCC1 family protein
MAKTKGGKFEIRVTDIEDPLADATFGSIGRYVEVAFPDQNDEPVVPQRLTLRFDEKQAKHVDQRTLVLFRVDIKARTFTPIESSRVHVSKHTVTAWVNQPGTYGLIGLPKNKTILETLRLFERFAPELLEERERGEHELHNRICGLILCPDPVPGSDSPPGPSDLCEKCLGVDLSFEKLPELFLLERRLEIPKLFEVFEEEEEEEEAPGGPSLLAWGWNTWGDLGDGSKVRHNTPVWVAPNLKAKKIVGGGIGDWGLWTLALDTNGTVWAWGHNVAGQHGNGTVSASDVPVRVGSLNNIVDIAAGTDHGIAVHSDGSVWRWGWPESLTSFTPDLLPVRVVGINDIVAVAAGHRFNLALRNDGRVFAWGDNSLGQLGDGSGLFRANPVQVPALTTVRSIAAGPSSSFAINSNGSVMAWGAGGTIGDGTMVNRLSPVPIPGLNNIEQIAASHNALARTTAGEVWFWGTNFYGESGDGTVAGSYLSPVRVPGLPVITGIAVGGSHNVALQSNGTVWAWGSGIVGEIGIEPVWVQTTPVQVPLPGARRAALVGAGWRASFAIIA